MALDVGRTARLIKGIAMARMSFVEPPLVSLGHGIIHATPMPALRVDVLREMCFRGSISSRLSGFKLVFSDTPVIDVDEWPFLTFPRVRRILPGDVVNVSVQYSTAHFNSRGIVESVLCDSVECTVELRCIPAKAWRRDRG